MRGEKHEKHGGKNKQTLKFQHTMYVSHIVSHTTTQNFEFHPFFKKFKKKVRDMSGLIGMLQEDVSTSLKVRSLL